MKLILAWRPVGSDRAIPITFDYDAENYRVIYKLPEGLEFGQLELNGVAVTGYFTPADPDTEYVLRPLLLGMLDADE